jgi:ribosomal protein S27E
MARIAQLQVTCKHCRKTTNVFIQETNASSADVKCEHCRKVFVFSSGMLYNPIGYVLEIPEWARITEEDKRE